MLLDKNLKRLFEDRNLYRCFLCGYISNVEAQHLEYGCINCQKQKQKVKDKKPN